MNNSNWIPEIMYEESEDGISSNIPFVMVPEGETMPHLLYIFESSETGEFEPGSDGEELPVIEWDLHQYADMLLLKKNLSQMDYDKVRIALGLEEISVAAEKGKEITTRIRNVIEKE